MGIYRSLLEEEVPHLDDNNNPDEEIKELEAIIKDSDANEAEQDAAQAAEFGPDCGVDDIMDESAMAIYEFELANNEIMKSIGIAELHEAACGREFLLEGAKAKAFFEKAKAAIKKFFAKVWQVLKRWGANLAATFTSSKKLISNDKMVKAMNAGYPIASKEDKKKGFTFEGLDGAIAIANGAKAMDMFTTRLERYWNGHPDSEFDADNAAEIMNEIRQQYCGKACSAGEFGSELRKKIYGSDEAVEINYPTVDQIKTILSDKKNNMDAVKKFSKGAKEEFGKAIKDVNKMEAKAKDLPEGESYNAYMSSCVRANTCLRSALTTVQSWRSVVLSGIRAQAGQARKFAMLYIKAGNKEANPGFHKESTEYGFLSGLGLV